MVRFAALNDLATEKASSFSPWIWSTGLILSTDPMAAAAGVMRPLLCR